jgi:hypothetical protein
MARVFTVNFTFKDELHSALISFESRDYDMSFLVRYLDHELQEIIPGRRIVVSLSEGIKSPKILTKTAEELLARTTEAISEHLHS